MFRTPIDARLSGMQRRDVGYLGGCTGRLFADVGAVLVVEVGKHESFFVVQLAEYLVVAQVVAVTDTEPAHATGDSSSTSTQQPIHETGKVKVR